MKTRLHIGIWTILVLFILPQKAIAQSDLRFHHLLVGSQNNAEIAAMDMCRDDFGFLWIATYRGLARFDGDEMTLVSFSKPGGIDYGRLEIHQMVPLKNGQLLLATARKGLFIYHTKNGDFEVFNSTNSTLRSNQIRGICVDKTGIVWITSEAGLDFMKLNDRTIYPFAQANQQFNANAIFSMHMSRREQLFVATQTGVFKLESWQNNQPQMKMVSSLTGVSHLSERVSGELWMATRQGDLFRCDISNNEIIDSFLATDNRNALPHAIIRTVFTDRKNRLWVGTRDGLALFDEESNDFTVYKHIEGNYSSLTNSTVNGIYDDDMGQVYFLTQSAIDFISPNSKPISVLNLQSVDSTSPLLTDPLCTYRDSRGRLWMGTSKGLAFVDHNQRSLLQQGSGSWQSNYVLEVLELPNGDLYFATSKGLALLTKENYDALDFFFFPFRNRQFEGEGAASFLITDLHYDGNGFLWMSTNNGYSQFNVTTHEFQSARDEGESSASGGGNAMNKIIVDQQGNLWIGTRNSGLRFIAKGNAFQKNKMCYIVNDPTVGTSLSNDAVTDIFEDKQGKIWVSTYYGLNRLDTLFYPNEPAKCRVSFTRFGKDLGWQTEVFSSVQQDQADFLWVGSLGGLYRFNPQKSEINHYAIPDGLISDGVMADGLKLCSDGYMYVSMRNGASWFHPDSLALSNAPPSKPIITHFALFNVEVPTSVTASANAPLFLVNGISYTKEVSLKHDQNVITIGFTGLDILNVSKQRYRYMLEGFERNWVESGYENSATYTNLSPGDYTFKVMTTNGDGIWSPTAATLSIIVLPPWYQTWWAYILFALVFVNLVWAYVKTRIAIVKREMNIRMEGEKKVNEARMEEREFMRQKNARDFHDETGVKLTRINLLTTAASQKSQNQQVKDCLKQIEINTKDLTGSMRDFVWSLDPQKDTLSSILQRLQDFGNQLFEYSETAFITQSSFSEWQHIELSFDSKFQLLLIFKEAMNNVSKYSQAESVQLSCKENDEGILISLTDDGVGFDPSISRESYGLKNMQQRANKLNARLDISSTIGEGSSVIIVLPKPKQDNH